jgi:hypothetical protein
LRWPNHTDGGLFIVHLAAGLVLFGLGGDRLLAQAVHTGYDAGGFKVCEPLVRLGP